MSDHNRTPGARRLRRGIIWLVFAALLVALSHGIYLPVSWVSRALQPVLQDRAVRLEFDDAVVSLWPQPRLRLLSATLYPTESEAPDTQGALLSAGLMSFSFSLNSGPGRGWIQWDGLQLKQAKIHIAANRGEGLNWNAWRRAPPRSQRAFTLPDTISLQNVAITIENVLDRPAEIFIDRAHWQASTPQAVHLALRIAHPMLKGTLQAQGESAPSPDGPTIKELSAEFRGDFDGYPWSVTLAADRLTPSRVGQAAEIGQFRVYVKRDDDPDEHQAVFSVAQARFLPQDGRVFLRQGEWTYTHEKAEAWSFDATVDLALRQTDITPLTVPGSEAIPAPTQRWRWPCESVASRSGWWWTKGWWTDSEPRGRVGEPTSTVVCLVRQAGVTGPGTADK